MTDRVRKFIQRTQSGVGRSAARAEGDRARDVRDWKAAEIAYRSHLGVAGDDQPIWIQLGHCLKEQGRLEEAEGAYRRGVELDDKSADSYLQLGHVLKLQSKFSLAEQAYKTSFDLQPSKAAHDEMMSLDHAETAVSYPTAVSLHDSAAMVYLEVDDLLDYLRNHKTLSGIQRVQVGIISHVLGRPPSDEQQHAFVRTGKHGSGFWRLDPADLAAVIDYVGQAVVSQEKLLSLIQLVEQRALLIEPVAGQTYLVLGAFWGFGSNAARYSKLKMAGVRVGVYIYDLIPITHPEYCASGLVSEFTLALADGLHSFDFILTISDFVAHDVRKFIAKHKLRTVPVEPVLLAHQMNERPKLARAEHQWRGALAPLQGRRFVMMVSTIEARKNHIYLYNVWKALLDEGLDPPDLVFVGRFGWRVNDLHDMLQGTNFLDRRIHVLHDISDVDLEMLYQSCLFTAFPSVVEGWGLPVGESLAHGRPCVASNTSSIPEVGGPLVDYIDPWNLREGISVFRKMILDEKYRARRVAEIETRFVARTWDDVGRELLQRLGSLARVMPAVATYRPPLLAAGELLVPGQLAVGQVVAANYPNRPLRPTMAESWYPFEPFGCWMRGTEGNIWFQSDQPPGTQISVYLQLAGAPWVGEHIVTIRVGSQTASKADIAIFPQVIGRYIGTERLDPAKPRLCRATGTVDADGTVMVRISIQGPEVRSHSARSADDDRIFYAGLIRMVYAPVADARMRVDLSEFFSAFD